MLLISSMTLSKLLNLPVSQFHYLYNENINVTFTALLWNEVK